MTRDDNLVDPRWTLTKLSFQKTLWAHPSYPSGAAGDWRTLTRRKPWGQPAPAARGFPAVEAQGQWSASIIFLIGSGNSPRDQARRGASDLIGPPLRAR
jgi:hypothetical protein